MNIGDKWKSVARFARLAFRLPQFAIARSIDKAGRDRAIRLYVGGERGAGSDSLVQPTCQSADIIPARLTVTGDMAANTVYDATTMANL